MIFGVQGEDPLRPGTNMSTNLDLQLFFVQVRYDLFVEAVNAKDACSLAEQECDLETPTIDWTPLDGTEVLQGVLEENPEWKDDCSVYTNQSPQHGTRSIGAWKKILQEREDAFVPDSRQLTLGF